MAVSGLYTPPYGWTTQGQQLADRQDTLGSIRGNISQIIQQQPQNIQAAGQAVATQQDIPGAMGQYGNMMDLYKMFVADHAKAQTMAQALQEPQQPTQPQQSGQPFTGEAAWNPTSGYQAVTQPSPSLVSGLLQSQGNTQQSLIKNLADYITTGFGNIKNARAEEQQTFRDVLGVLSNMAQRETMTPYEKEQIALSKRGQALKEFEAGYQQQGISPIDPKDYGSEREYWQAKYLASPNDNLKKKIADTWKAAHKSSLFPSELPPAEIDKINATRDTLDRVNRIIDMLGKNKDRFPQGIAGKLAEASISTGLAGTVNIPGLTPEIQQIIGDLMLIRGQGDRQLIGGRITGYLLDRLGIGFPGVEKDANTNLLHLNQLKNTLMEDLQTYADTKGYNSIYDLPGMEGEQTTTGGRPPLSSFDQ